MRRFLGKDPAAVTGKQKEGLARRYLERQGLRFVAANYSCRRGEIDLVMDADGTTVFVEVRYRRSRRFGGAVESIDRRKRERLIATANRYLQQHASRAKGPCRFDVVAIEGPERQQQFIWLPNAFTAD